MITRSGAKLLDFGLAKITESAAASAGEPSAMPKQTSPLTREGVILGTLQYMAPEQLEGREADARTDIFAFGATLFEMLTGRKAFEGKRQASLISAIMTAPPPPVSNLQPLASPVLDRLNASTGKTEKSIPLPEQLIYGGTGALAVTPTGDRVYASSPGGPVVVIDTKTQNIVASIAGTIGSGLAISPAGDIAYISSSSPNSLTDVVDLSTNQVIGTLPLDSIGIVFSADSARAYLSTYGNSALGAYAIAVVDTSTLAVLDFVPGAFGGSGESLALTSDGKLLYAGGLSSNQATPVWAGAMIDRQSLKVVKRFAAGPVVVIH
jgi:serine/threonine protein kinase